MSCPRVKALALSSFAALAACCPVCTRTASRMEPSALSSSTGTPLPPSLSVSMGSALGSNLDAVRVHTGQQAASAAKELNANAFTRGQDIFFGTGRYQPDTTEGQKLLAHELTHTIQQGASGPLI